MSKGAVELNPLMRWAIEQGEFWFIMLKTSTALVGLVLLCTMPHVRTRLEPIPGRRFKPAPISVAILLLAYGLLVIYHAHLLGRSPV
jgi:hypothetical protein